MAASPSLCLLLALYAVAVPAAVLAAPAPHPRPFGRFEHRFELGAGPMRGVAMPLADLASAFHSTGIPNIETYVVMSGRLVDGLRLGRREADFDCDL